MLHKLAQQGSCMCGQCATLFCGQTLASRTVLLRAHIPTHNPTHTGHQLPICPNTSIHTHAAHLVGMHQVDLLTCQHLPDKPKPAKDGGQRHAAEHGQAGRIEHLRADQHTHVMA